MAYNRFTQDFEEDEDEAYDQILQDVDAARTPAASPVDMSRLSPAKQSAADSGDDIDYASVIRALKKEQQQISGPYEGQRGFGLALADIGKVIGTAMMGKDPGEVVGRDIASRQALKQKALDTDLANKKNINSILDKIMIKQEKKAKEKQDLARGGVEYYETPTGEKVLRKSLLPESDQLTKNIKIELDESGKPKFNPLTGDYIYKKVPKEKSETDQSYEGLKREKAELEIEEKKKKQNQFKITGFTQDPKITPTDDDVKKVKEMKSGYDAYKQALNDYKKVIKGVSRTDRLSYGSEIYTEIGSAYESLFTKAKEAEKLGALAGGDIDLMKRTIPDASAIKNVMLDSKQIEKAISNINNRNFNTFKARTNAYGYVPEGPSLKEMEEALKEEGIIK